MSKTTSTPARNQAPGYHLEHFLILAITVIFGTISAAAVLYHIIEAGQFEKQFTMVFAVLGAAFAFGMAIMPAALARPHGEAIEGASAQSSILLVVIMMMVVDGALQWHAISVITEELSMKMPPWWATLLVIASFQISMFASRGALAASTSEQNEMIAAEAERLAAIEAHARAEKNKKRREKYAAKKNSQNVVALR